MIYNKNMEKNDNKVDIEKDKNINEEISPKSEEVTKSGLVRKNGKWVITGISMSMVVLVAVIAAVITIVMNRNDNTEKADTGSYPTIGEEGNNTELSSGSVSVVIDNKTINYKGAYVVDGIEAKITSGTYESANADEAVFLVVNGGSLNIEGDVTINKTGPEDFEGRGDGYSFYGINSAVVVVGENSSANIDGVTINTDVSGANAVVATDGGVAKISESTISTAKDNSRGLHATFGGMINADNVKITTQGASCAALATDRGEGTVVADNMTLSTAGAGSPLIYSTGKITVTNSSGTATGAQISVVEGKNSVNLQGCEFAANGNGNRGSVDNAGVMIYQSMSGDASTGTGSFTATDCHLSVSPSSSVYATTPFFFITNTSATIDLTGTDVKFSGDEYFISALGTSEWGRSGSNGGKVNLSMNSVDATNTNVEVDSISSVSGL